MPDKHEVGGSSPLEPIAAGKAPRARNDVLSAKGQDDHTRVEFIGLHRDLKGFK